MRGSVFPLLVAALILAPLGLSSASAQEPSAAREGGIPATAPAAETETRIAYIYRPVVPPSSYDAEADPDDLGVAGARMAVKDNNTTARFLTKQTFVLEEASLEQGASAVDAAKALAARGLRYFVVALPAAEVLAVADALKDQGAIVFNTAAPDDALRGSDCRANVFHTIPSRAMQTDALAQYMTLMRWRKIFLIVGPSERDQAYAESMRGSAKKFGLKVTADKPWTFGPLMKARGDTPTRAEAMVFTRGLDYDLAIVADEEQDWGEYVPYRTVDPRPVAGTAGLIATTWHPTLETWGAAQAQNRFRRLTSRLMRPLDYQAWLGVRSVGEAASQKKSADPATIIPYLAEPAFNLPAYKGVSLSYRPWDHQLRQPIIVVQPKAMVSVAPEQGFVHQRTPLDSLGTDQPESACKFK